jgi:hypothetical protein
VLREPLALRQLALAPDPRRLALTLAMLSKRYRDDAPTLVKANVPVNFLLPALVAAAPEARSIFLYATLPDYLLAILRSDNHREWLRLVTGQLAAHLGDLSGRSDAERCAPPCGWRRCGLRTRPRSRFSRTPGTLDARRRLVILTRIVEATGTLL